MDLATIFAILTLAVAASAVGVSFYGAVNAKRAAKSSATAAKSSASNGEAQQTLIVKTDRLTNSINGRLAAEIATIHAKAEAEAATARADAFQRESDAFRRGQAHALNGEPLATAAAVAELRQATLAAVDAVKAIQPVKPLENSA